MQAEDKTIKKAGSVKVFIILAIILIFLFSALTASYLLISKKINSEVVKLGVISDIHAGNQKTREDASEPNNIVAPVNFEKNLTAALDGTKDCDYILILGDNSNNESEKYTTKLKELTKDYPVLWVKGNHDKAENFRNFSENNYYYLDKNSWRIIVLDNSSYVPKELIADVGQFSDRGWIGRDQLEWLRDSLKTEKNVIIAMHVPIFQEKDIKSLKDDQEYLKKIFSKHGNVRHVVFGHYHVYDEVMGKEGIQYHFIPSVSLVNFEGSYGIIELRQSVRDAVFTFLNRSDWFRELNIN